MLEAAIKLDHSRRGGGIVITKNKFIAERNKFYYSFIHYRCMYFCEFILTHGIRIQSIVLWFWELILWFQSPCLPELALFDQYDLSKDTMVINIIQSYYTSLYTYWLAYLYHPIRKQERCVVLLTDSQKETLCLACMVCLVPRLSTVALLYNCRSSKNQSICLKILESANF